MDTDNRIKCGKCSSEYRPRVSSEPDKMDYSCPVCGHGKFKESLGSSKKQILKDSLSYEQYIR